MLSPEDRERYGLTPPGAASGMAGVEQRLEAVLAELLALRQELAARAAPPPPEGDTVVLKEPGTAPRKRKTR